MAKLDDFLGKKKESVPILDLSRTVVNSDEEFRRLLEKVPDFKIRPEKVPPESIKIKDKKKCSFKTGKKDLKAMREPYAFMDPLPVEMKNLKVGELAAVPIDWKMLTTLRPKSKIEENYFSRLVELGKLEHKTRIYMKRQILQDPQIRRVKNKSGIVEYRVSSCPDCKEDFCNGVACNKFNYDSFARVSEAPKNEKLAQQDSTEKAKKKSKVKRKARSKSRSKKKGHHKSKSKSKSPTK